MFCSYKRSLILFRFSMALKQTLFQLQRLSRCVSGTYGRQFLPVKQFTGQLTVRSYAKGRSRGGDQKKKPTGTGAADIEGLQKIFDPAQLEADMKEQLERLKEEFVKQLSVRTSTQAFESLTVTLPEGPRKLNHLAKITFKTPQLILIDLGSAKHNIKAVNEAILKSGLNVTPQQEGNFLVVPVPKVTREVRENLAKNAKGLYNQYKERIQQVFKGYNKAIQTYKLGPHPADLVIQGQTFLEGTVKKFSHQGEELMKQKQKELLEDFK